MLPFVVTSELKGPFKHEITRLEYASSVVQGNFTLKYTHANGTELKGSISFANHSLNEAHHVKRVLVEQMAFSDEIIIWRWWEPGNIKVFKIQFKNFAGALPAFTYEYNDLTFDSN